MTAFVNFGEHNATMLLSQVNCSSKEYFVQLPVFGFLFAWQ